MDRCCYYDVRGFAEELVNKLHDSDDLGPIDIKALEIYPQLLQVVARVMELIDNRLEGVSSSHQFQWRLVQQESILMDLIHDLERKRMLELIESEAA